MVTETDRRRFRNELDTSQLARDQNLAEGWTYLGSKPHGDGLLPGKWWLVCDGVAFGGALR
jgi:hypothetical protein